MKNSIKKILVSTNVFVSSLVLGVSSVMAAAPLVVEVHNPIKTNDFSELVENFLLWILSVAGALALLMLVAGGVLYVTSSGNEQKIETARKMITWTILGLMLILASYSIIVVLDKILT
ncbi:MAG: pilin [Patescibacteria group bacterium]|nr:pilin [Patescibacteria group bacterium]